ncbi:MAG: hypothetical protein NTZ83_02275 [Candidatus Pacearchaeota archaeon]|nr:hypothetical protein [Candidatus Pacearchaeota archaeon]
MNKKTKAKVKTILVTVPVPIIIGKDYIERAVSINYNLLFKKFNCSKEEIEQYSKKKFGKKVFIILNIKDKNRRMLKTLKPTKEGFDKSNDKKYDDILHNPFWRYKRK